MPVIATSGTGGSAITSYNLQYDQGRGVVDGAQQFVSLIGEIPDDNTGTLQMTLPGLNGDTNYAFRYRVKNKHGWSDYSAISSFLTATVPSTMVSPTFSIEPSSPTSVTLSWAEPANGGNNITAYSILIRNTTGTGFFTETSYCNGASNLVLQTRVCHIPFTVLRAAPFSLTQGQLIVVKIAAINSVGMGIYSTENTAGINIQTEPQNPASPPTSS